MLHHMACSAHERVGNYWYLMPAYAQCRKALWQAVNPHTGKLRIDEAFPLELRSGTNQQEMSIQFKNGSSFQLVGSDNFDSLVGSTPVGLVFSEYALSNPSSWGFLRPILLENNGWAAFNSTPRGRNHFRDLFMYAEKTEGWFTQTLTAEQANIFSPEQLQSELDGMVAEHGEAYGRSLWQQEYFASFDAALPGSIWGEQMETAKAEGRIGEVPHEPEFPVFTAWDLGFDDATAVWFFQVIRDEIRVIDFFEANLKSIEFYADMLRTKAKTLKYSYGIHYLPHDARPRTLAAGGKSILQQLINAEIGACQIVKKLDVEEGIQAARATFGRCWFETKKCEIGVDHLLSYRRSWDEEKKMFSPTPVHDNHSHAADAFRGLALSWKKGKNVAVTQQLSERLLTGNTVAQTWGALKQRHFSKLKRDRADRFH